MPQVVANGITLFYEDRGAGAPTVFISGWGQDHTAWNMQLDRFSGYRRCIALDNRGAGLTDAPPGPYSAWMMAMDVAEVLKSLQLERVDVVGLSMGGLIAQALAEFFPDRVRSLCVVGSWASTSEYQKSLFRSLVDAYRAGGLDLFLSVVVPSSFAPETFERPGYVEKLVKAALSAERRMGTAAFEAQAAACLAHDDPGNLGSIRCPTLVVCGRHDRIAPPEGSEYLTQAIPGARLKVFERSGHLPVWEEVEAFNEELDGFWRGIR